MYMVIQLSISVPICIWNTHVNHKILKEIYFDVLRMIFFVWKLAFAHDFVTWTSLNTYCSRNMCLHCTYTLFLEDILAVIILIYKANFLSHCRQTFFFCIQWWFVYPDTFVTSRYFRINKFSGLLNSQLVWKWKSVPTPFVRISDISGLSEPGLTNHHCIQLQKELTYQDTLKRNFP